MTRALAVSVWLLLAGCGGSDPPRLSTEPAARGPRAGEPFLSQKQPALIPRPAEAVSAARGERTKQDLVAQVNSPVTLMGDVGGVGTRAAGALFIHLTDGPGLWVRLDTDWPAAVVDEHAACGECLLGAEISGELLQTGDGDLYFHKPVVTRFWRQAVEDPAPRPAR